jgi:hypothetical protein
MFSSLNRWRMKQFNSLPEADKALLAGIALSAVLMALAKPQTTCAPPDSEGDCPYPLYAGTPCGFTCSRMNFTMLSIGVPG